MIPAVPSVNWNLDEWAFFWINLLQTRFNLLQGESLRLRDDPEYEDERCHCDHPESTEEQPRSNQILYHHAYTQLSWVFQQPADFTHCDIAQMRWKHCNNLWRNNKRAAQGRIIPPVERKQRWQRIGCEIHKNSNAQSTASQPQRENFRDHKPANRTKWQLHSRFSSSDRLPHITPW